MAQIVRQAYPQIRKRLLANERFIQVMVGPRQVGKTTLVAQLLKDWDGESILVSADAQANAGSTWIAEQWNSARAKLGENPNRNVVLVFDEIQKIDNWSETIKKYWDEDTRDQRNLKVILLGSSRLMLQQGLTESLAGRFEKTYLGHWTLGEMQEAFGLSLDEYLWFGGYPGAAQLIGDEERWRRYVNDSLIETSISKDVLMLTQVAKPALMRRLFEIGTQYTAQILSFTKILGQLADAGNTVTLARYLELLDTAGLLGGLEKFAPDTIRQRGSSPKFQVHNNALLSALNPMSFADWQQNPKEKGRWVESAVGAYLLNCSLEQGFKLFYWRERNDEVDFVLERRGKVACIEVKFGVEKPTPGLAKFAKQFPDAKLCATGGTGIPLQEFLKLNPLELF